MNLDTPTHVHNSQQRIMTLKLDIFSRNQALKERAYKVSAAELPCDTPKNFTQQLWDAMVSNIMRQILSNKDGKPIWSDKPQPTK